MLWMLVRSPALTANGLSFTRGDESLSYCYECAVKQVEQLCKLHPENKDEFIVAGGYATEGDSQAFCEICGCALENNYTDYCCECELDHFEECGFDQTDPSHCHSLTEILCTNPAELSERIEALAMKIIGATASAV
jgi:hypothetical protein